MSQRDTILARIREIPALPPAVGKVLSLARDPKSGVTDIIRAVEFDPGLTSDILRLANSAFFAGPRKVGSLRDAGVLLGIRRMVELVVSSAIAPLTAHAIKGYDLPPGKLLEQMISVAIGSEMLSRHLGSPPPPHTFTAVLLHSIGNITLGTFVAVDVDEIHRLVESGKISFDEAEERVVGIARPEAGAYLLEYGQLPDDIVQVARWYRNPDNIEGDKRMGDLVHAASIITMECGIGLGVDGLQYTVSPGTISRLRLNTRVMERTGAEMLSQLEGMRAQLAPAAGGK